MVISGFHTTSSILKSFCMRPVACGLPIVGGLSRLRVTSGDKQKEYNDMSKLNANHIIYIDGQPFKANEDGCGT
jgi:hypothetical protein